MTDDEIIDIFASDEDLIPGIEAALERWPEFGAKCRHLLHGFITGDDYSERTERALFAIVHLLGERADTASFPDLCTLAIDPDRFASVMGDDAATLSFPPILLGTFGGDPAPLFGLIENSTADELARGDALLVLAYLARTGRLPEREVYDYLAALPARLRPVAPHFVWFGFGRAVAALGFGGLSGAVEIAIAGGLITPDLMQSADFWQDLRDSQQHPHDVDGPIWDGLAPMGSTVAFLASFDDAGGDGAEPDYPTLEPARNPLRGVGRNDPCPCGSGKKYKKCCLPTAG